MKSGIPGGVTTVTGRVSLNDDERYDDDDYPEFEEDHDYKAPRLSNSRSLVLRERSEGGDHVGGGVKQGHEQEDDLDFAGEEDDLIANKKSQTKKQPDNRKTWTANRDLVLRMFFSESSIKISLAILCLGGICATWVGMAHIGQYIQDEGFEKPYFMAWFAHSIYIWFFPMVEIMRRLVMRSQKGSVSVVMNLSPPSRFSLLQYLKTSVVVAIIVFFMLYLWYLSLPKTSVAINTSIYQSASIVVYVLSVCLFKESVSVLKVVSVLLCLMGVFLISFGDQYGNTQEGDVAGYLFLVASTILYAVYEVTYRYMGVDATDTKTEAFYHALLVLAFIGVFTLFIFWPGLLILHFTGHETFQWPTGMTLVLIFLMALCESLFNLCLLTGIFLTSPLFISVGSMLAIPAAIVTDHLLGKLDLTSMGYSGIACVIFGFCGLNFAEWHHQKTLVAVEE